MMMFLPTVSSFSSSSKRAPSPADTRAITALMPMTMPRLVNVERPLLTTRAAIEPVRGMDLIKGGQDVTQTYVTVTVRYNAAIQASMRVKALNGTYIIQSINNINEQNRVMKLLCLGLKGNL